MRGDMQVRFGGRYGKTYCRKAVRRSVPSLRAGKGGNIIALAKELYCSDSLPYLLNRIAEQTPHVRPVSFSFPQRKEVVCVIDNSFLSNKGLEDFEEEWKIFQKDNPDYRMKVYNTVGSVQNALLPFGSRFSRTCPQTVLACLHAYGSPLIT